MPIDNILIKKPHTRQQYTEYQLQEIMKCTNPKTGYLHFMKNYFYIQHPTKGKLKFEPFDYQLELLHGYHNYRQSCNMLGRQLGKTTCAAGYLLWFAMFNDNQTILIAAHKFSGSQEIMHRVRYAYECCPDFIRAGAVSYNKGSIDFDNGTRIISTTTTENTGRGLSVSLLYLDEFSSVLPSIATEFWTSISPTLSTGGKAIITSTPNNDDDVFATIWKDALDRFDEHGNEQDVGKNGFYAYMATWERHPDRDEAWANAEISKMGLSFFSREHNCLVHQTMVNIMDDDGNTFEISIGDLYNLL